MTLRETRYQVFAIDGNCPVDADGSDVVPPRCESAIMPREKGCDGNREHARVFPVAGIMMGGASGLKNAYESAVTHIQFSDHVTPYPFGKKFFRRGWLPTMP